ncbi:MAG: hypothetical protein ACO1PM_08120 [Acidovorax sp.]
MARRITYTGPPVITPQQVAEWRKDEAVLVQSVLLSSVIIPGVVAQCEARTGAAIQAARYEDHWPAHYASGQALDVGQASAVESVEVIGADGTATSATAAHYLQRGGRESFLHFPQGRPAGMLRITYEAGADLDAYPSVLNWLLLNISTVYAQRESMVIGGGVVELPSNFLDSMLSDIAVPPRF